MQNSKVDETMKSITIRISDEDDASLQKKSEETGSSVSEIVRDVLFNHRKLQIDDALASIEDKIVLLSNSMNNLSDVSYDAIDVANKTYSIAQSNNTLLTNETLRPFGMRLAFFQAAIMSVYTVAKATFLQNPTGWEPIKEDTRHRAFRKEE